MDNISEMLEKYSFSTINNLDNENTNKIVDFLLKQKCNYIEDILEDYLDLFTIPYDTFVEKFQRLNYKYNSEYLRLASSNMNLFEEFFYD